MARTGHGRRNAGDLRDPRRDRHLARLTVRVLLVSQYYAPEVGATQNRMHAFTEAILAAGHDVTVICEQPNHPGGIFHEGYGRSPLRRQRGERLTVNRLWVLTSPRKTTLRRLLFYGTFAAGAFALTATMRNYDIVLVTSPPLPGAFGAALAARLRGMPVVLDVRDLWPAAAEALGELSNPRVITMFEGVERWLYRNAAAVTATTRPFCRHIDSVAGKSIASHVPNGALDSLVALPNRPPPSHVPFRVGYFGNFGIAQGLGIVFEAARLLAGDPVEFLLVGAGPLEAELRARAAELGLTNVVLRQTVDTNQVGDLLLSCHALLIPLRDHPLLGDFIPSKLYDAMAVGRPAIVAARGEAADFVTEHGFGMVVSPEDGAALADATQRLADDREYATRLGAAGKAAARDYARSSQAKRLCQLLESLRSDAPKRSLTQI
jgi:glycosyltransferase involved in cell wall biosynthesis